MDLTELENNTLQLLTKIQNEKQERRTYPSYALWIADIIPRLERGQTKVVKQTLNALITKGFVAWGHTINDLHFERKI